MKKIFSLGIASAVLALTAVAASAGVAPVAPETAVAGETVTFDVVTTSEVEDIQFKVEVEGLEFVSAEPHAAGAWDEANAGFALATANALAEGTTVLSLTYTVTADVDSDISFALVATDDSYADAVDSTAVTVTVVEGDEPTADTNEPTDEPTDEPTGETDEPNVPTGVALAVVPAVLAGAAVVVAKKRK